MALEGSASQCVLLFIAYEVLPMSPGGVVSIQRVGCVFCVSPEIFEYPAGKNFELRDPSGYCVLLSNDAAQNPAPASKRERPDQDLSSLAELVGDSTKKAGD